MYPECTLNVPQMPECPTPKCTYDAYALVTLLLFQVGRSTLNCHTAHTLHIVHSLGTWVLETRNTSTLASELRRALDCGTCRQPLVADLASELD